MILLDTNVVSELFKPRPHVAVVAWLDSQSIDLLYICAPVLAELRFGMELLDEGQRKEWLRTAIGRLERVLYRDRILSFDSTCAAVYGRIGGERRKAGRSMQQMDGIIASIALANSAVLATRNTRHFADLGLELINPFEASVERKS